jgi:hypothetical protein
MKITDEMVQRTCEYLASIDWLQKGWDSTGDQQCKECGHPYHYGEGDGGKAARAEVRGILEVALNQKGN